MRLHRNNMQRPIRPAGNNLLMPIIDLETLPFQNAETNNCVYSQAQEMLKLRQIHYNRGETGRMD